MPTLTINSREVTVPQGTNVVDAAKTIGAEIPHYCYHPALNVVASCRMCFAEVTQDMRGKLVTKLQTACNTPATDGLVVRTDTDAVKKCQNDVLEFLLINHPVDCPVCDEAGECKLQDYAFTYGTRYSRFGEQKRFRHAKKLGAGVRLYTNRCILCDRCVRFLRDYVGTGELTVANMGNANEIVTFPGKPIDNEMAGNVVDLCPVGALLSEDFLFKTRVWNVKPKSSICPGCSRGCATYLDVKDNEVQRTRARENAAVNTYFICDAGRYLYHVILDEKRVEFPCVRMNEAMGAEPWEAALDLLATRLKSDPSRTIILVSPFVTMEEATSAADLARALPGATLALLPNACQDEPRRFPGGFAIDGDRAPNTAGLASVMTLSLDDIAISADSVVFAVNSSHVLDSVSPPHMEKIRGAGFVGVVDVLFGPLATTADVVLAGRMWAEKAGTVVNSLGMEQQFAPAVSAPPQTRTECDILRDLTRLVSVTDADSSGAAS